MTDLALFGPEYTFNFNTTAIYNFKIVRAAVPLPSISASYMVDDKTGYLKINRFSQTTFSEFEKRFESFLKLEGTGI